MTVRVDPNDEPTRAELARAARILALRMRREASGSFAGGYASAFRGGGMEFDESRPYVPGDDVRALDWNALARTGELFVKRFREERDQVLLLALDVSGSMRFGTAAPAGVAGIRSKAGTAAHAAALLAAAAGHAGDRVGLLTFDREVRLSLPPGRGPAHTWHVVRSAVIAASSSSGSTRVAAASEALRSSERAVAVLLSDFRDPAILRGANEAMADLAGLGKRHHLVSIVLHDRREDALPRVGLVRLEDPERPGRTLLLNTNSERARSRYAKACSTRRLALERSLRALRSDVVWLRTDRDPLHVLSHYLRERAGRMRRAA